MQPHAEQPTRSTDAAVRSTASATTAAKPGLSPPQFRLSSLLTVTAVVCFALALAKVIHPMLSALIVLSLLIVFAHVAGNVLGTQLKKSSRHAEPLEGLQAPSRVPIERKVCAPATRLSHRTRLGWGTLMMSSLGGVAGATGGGWLLWWSMNGNASIPSMALGVVSCGVLGGFWGFGVSSLLGVLGGALWHAHQEPSEP